MEPTQGAGPCIGEAGLLDQESVAILEAVLDVKGYPAIDVLIHASSGVEVYLRVAGGLDCAELLEARARFCGDASARQAFQAVDWPEISRAIVERGCVEIVIPADPVFRVREALGRLGLRPPFKAEAYRPVERLE